MVVNSLIQAVAVGGVAAMWTYTTLKIGRLWAYFTYGTLKICNNKITYRALCPLIAQSAVQQSFNYKNIKLIAITIKLTKLLITKHHKPI